MQNLTAREVTVVKALGEGKRNKQIAWELGLAENTVKVYAARICGKVGVDGRVNLALWAQHAGLVDGSLPAFEAVRAHLISSEFTLDQARELLLLILDRSRAKPTPIPLDIPRAA